MFQVKEYQGADGFPLRYGELTNPENPSTGRAMLFIPGLGGSVKGALNFLEALLPYFSPIYGPDLRGFGLNPVEKPVRSVKTPISDLEAFHQQVLIPAGHTDLTLSGISLGGLLASNLAITHAERYQRLALLAPAYKANPASFPWIYTVRNTLAGLILGMNYQTRLPYSLTALTQNEEILNDPNYNQAPPLMATIGFLLETRDLGLRTLKNMTQVQLPTLMVIPGKDVVCDPLAMKNAYERIPTQTPKTLLDYPNFYHDVLFEVGHTEVAEKLIDWSAKAGTPSRMAR